MWRDLSRLPATKSKIPNGWRRAISALTACTPGHSLLKYHYGRALLLSGDYLKLLASPGSFLESPLFFQTYCRTFYRIYVRGGERTDLPKDEAAPPSDRRLHGCAGQGLYPLCGTAIYTAAS
jgi:hypothetical protein